MERIVLYLNEYSGIFSLMITIIVSIVILVLVRKGWKTFEELFQPYVVLYLTKMNYDEAVNYLVLENFGKRSASNMVRMDPDLQIEYPKDNPIQLFIDKRIPILAPAQKIVSALPTGDYTEKRYDCTISYEDDQGRVYTRIQRLDFSYTKLILFSASPESKILKSLDRILHNLEGVATRFKDTD